MSCRSLDLGRRRGGGCRGSGRGGGETIAAWLLSSGIRCGRCLWWSHKLEDWERKGRRENKRTGADSEADVLPIYSLSVRTICTTGR